MLYPSLSVHTDRLLESSPPHWLLCSVTRLLICLNLERSPCAQQTVLMQSTRPTVSLWGTGMPYSCPALSTPELCCQPRTSLARQTQKLELAGSSHESSQTPDELFMQSEQESMNKLEGNSLCKTKKGKESSSLRFLATDLWPQEVPGPAMTPPPQLPASWWREGYRDQTVTFKAMTN